MREYPDAFAKHPHADGCDGSLYRTNEEVHVDRLGRVGNGCIRTHEYACNMRWTGCYARVLVTERACRAIATSVEHRPPRDDRTVRPPDG